jgi:hypothetical protein
MFIFKKGCKPMEQEDEMSCCECCHCKRVFMLLVLLILAFIAGIMVGNCRSTYPGYMEHYMPHVMPAHIIKAKQLHRGALPKKAKPDNTTANNTPTEPTAQIGGYIIEIDQAQQ